jgi:hypothetical protein
VALDVVLLASLWSSAAEMSEEAPA